MMEVSNMDVIRIPDKVVIITEQGTVTDTEVSFEVKSGLEIAVTAREDLVKFVRLRWNMDMPTEAKFLGDAWERAYGDLEWRGYDADRVMPWYFIMSDLKGTVSGTGVMVRPNSMCSWNVDEQGVTLLLDVRNGGNGVYLNGRKLKAAVVVSKDYMGKNEFEVAQDFCGVMCTDPILPRKPVYGGNNWYYAYGNSSHEEILEDASYMAELAEGLENRPYMVIDDGWSPNLTQGPWDRGNVRFPDMAKLAEQISE